MEITNIEALIAQGKILKPADLNPANDYLVVGKFQNGNRKSGGDGNSYPSYVIPIKDIVVKNYKTYRAAFRDGGIGANPKVDVLENNLGFDPIWVRDGVGLYSTSDVFWDNKTDKVFCLFTLCPLTPPGYATCGISEEDNAILIRTYDRSGILSDGLLTDPDNFSRSYIEITVYN